MDPHTMIKLVPGEISIENILEKRKAYLTFIETQIENIEFGETASSPRPTFVFGSNAPSSSASECARSPVGGFKFNSGSSTSTTKESVDTTASGLLGSVDMRGKQRSNRRPAFSFTSKENGFNFTKKEGRYSASSPFGFKDLDLTEVSQETNSNATANTAQRLFAKVNDCFPSSNEDSTLNEEEQKAVSQKNHKSKSQIENNKDETKDEHLSCQSLPDKFYSTAHKAANATEEDAKQEKLRAEEVAKVSKEDAAPPFGGIDHLMTGMKFVNQEKEDEFRQQLKDSFTQKHHDYLHDAFHKVVSKWSDSSAINLDNSLFFRKSKEEFDELFQDLLKDLVSSSISADENEIVIIDKYYLHPTARKELHKTGDFYAQDQLQSVLLLLKEMYSCWRCKQPYIEDEGTETKSLICSGCKCAVYCSRECQVKHWKEGRHDECCESIQSEWSVYERKKKRVERALRKERIFTKQITVNGIKKECFLPPCEPLDCCICKIGTEELANVPDASMDKYYENIARLACGGKHLLFKEETLSSKLEEMIRNGYENVISEFKSATKEEIMDMHVIAEMLQYEEREMTKEELERRRTKLSIDRFITLYICYVPFNLGKEAFGVHMNKFLLEMNVLEDLNAIHKEKNTR